MRTFKKMICLVLLFSVLFCSFSSTSKAQTTLTGYAWRGEDGNIYFKCEDHRGTQKTYRTIGYTITRCIMGTTQRSPAGEYISFAFDSNNIQSEESTDEQGWTITIFKLSADTLLSKIAEYYPSWLAEVQSGKTCYLMIDSIMCCREYNSNTNSYDSFGSFKDDGSRTGVFLGNTYWNIPDTMTCSQCGGYLPCLKDGWNNWDNGISPTPICYGHPNAKEGDDAQFL